MASLRKKILFGALATTAAVAAGSAGLLWWSCRASLPPLDGVDTLPGATAAVSIERDALGVPTLRASTAQDAWRALGYVHAQDRFFQMDMLRRRAAGELSEVVGEATLGMDKWARMQGLRRAAEKALEALPADQRALAGAYAEGVNAGLASLSGKPWEYRFLRSEPRRWEPVDCLLVGLAMYIELQDAGGFEHDLHVLAETHGQIAVDFFAPLLASDDIAGDAELVSATPIPGPRNINLRDEQGPEGETSAGLHSRSGQTSSALALNAEKRPFLARERDTGSNILAVSGDHSSTGAGLLANDMHLGLSVPNTWYRAALRWTAEDGRPRQLTGLTLPGAPLMVVGSNGHVAWGFTNSFVDTADLIKVGMHPDDRNHYNTPEGSEPWLRETHQIAVRGKAPVAHEVISSRWGPLVANPGKRKFLALDWVARHPEAVDLRFQGISEATSAAEAIALAQNSGLPALNFMVVDSTGTAAWALVGRVPKRGYAARQPVDRLYGDRDWRGFLGAEELPKRIGNTDTRLSNGNERLLTGDELLRVGDGGYIAAFRGRQLRDSLAAATEAGKAPLQARDLLSIQLDDRALALKPWRELLLKVLSEDFCAAKAARRELRTQVEQWDDRATASGTAYRLVSAFRDEVANRVMDPIMDPCLAVRAEFNWQAFRYEPALWRLLKEQPPHLLAPEYLDWDELLRKSVDGTLEKTGSPASAQWGESNRLAMRHPLTRFLPRWLSFWADMPAAPQSGGNHMPRIARPAFGASERLVVAPGHEAEGLCHMPGGQSANPLSPYFRAGHEDWLQGRPSPLLPGPAEHKRVLNPR